MVDNNRKLGTIGSRMLNFIPGDNKIHIVNLYHTDLDCIYLSSPVTKFKIQNWHHIWAVQK